MSIVKVRGGRLKPAGDFLNIASWNIGGLTDAKTATLEIYIQKYSIDILCLQKTHRSKLDYYLTDNGFLIILSGSATGDSEFAGVGYMVSPWMRRHVVSFCQFSPRMASLKIRIQGGKMVVVSAYAPHSKYLLSKRQPFYQQLAEFVHSLSAHVPKLIYGDMNSRLYQRQPGEEEYFGPYIFSNGDIEIKADSNRNLLLELCSNLKMMVMNSFFPALTANLVTCYNVGFKPMTGIIGSSFSNRFLALPFYVAVCSGRRFC